jgi:regulatory protein YycH of two-component signal transduction system YycFG
MDNFNMMHKKLSYSHYENIYIYMNKNDLVKQPAVKFSQQELSTLIIASRDKHTKNIKQLIF